jgi:outer membrane lipoprotein-sorting protein
MRRPLLAAGLALAFALPSAAQTADEIVAKSLEARGGLEKLRAVKSMRFTGKMTAGPMEAPAVYEAKRPNKTRLDATVQGLTLTQAFDGTSGWQVMPFQGNKDPQPMSPEEQQIAEEESDFDGPLVDYKQKGNQVELLGKEKVEGTDAWKLKVTRKSGTVETLYLDADSFLAIKGESRRTLRGTEVESEQSIGDYKEVEGLLIPHSFESAQKGNPQRQRITIEKVELNVEIDDARFVMPARAAEPAKQD